MPASMSAAGLFLDDLIKTLSKANDTASTASAATNAVVQKVQSEKQDEIITSGKSGAVIAAIQSVLSLSAIFSSSTFIPATAVIANASAMTNDALVMYSKIMGGNEVVSSDWLALAADTTGFIGSLAAYVATDAGAANPRVALIAGVTAVIMTSASVIFTCAAIADKNNTPTVDVIKNRFYEAIESYKESAKALLDKYDDFVQLVRDGYSLADVTTVEQFMPYNLDELFLSADLLDVELWYSNSSLEGFSSNPDVLRGSAEFDFLQGNGIAKYILGNAGDDTLLGSNSPETFVWQQGDGLDWILSQESNYLDTFKFKGNTGAITVSKDSSNLVVTAENGGGVYIVGWDFNGSNNPTIETPDGTKWNFQKLNSLLTPAKYDITYSTEIVKLEEALPLLLSNVISSETFPLLGSYRQEQLKQQEHILLADALAASKYGEVYFDSNGVMYQKWNTTNLSMSTTSGLVISQNQWGDLKIGTSEEDVPGGHWGGAYAKVYSKLDWDYWKDSSGQEYVALTSVTSWLETGFTWQVPPTVDNPDWVLHNYTASNQLLSSLTGYRHSELVTPAVDSLTLFAGENNVSLIGVNDNQLTTALV